MQSGDSFWTFRDFLTYIGVLVIFLVLAQAFECSCKPQQFDCVLHISLPAVVAFVFVLWMDASFQRVSRQLFSLDARHTCSFLLSSCLSICRAAFIGLLWVVCLLIGGNWYVCCMNDQSEEQSQLACKSIGRLTDDERALIVQLKNKSRNLGSFLLFGLVLVPALVSSLGWRKPSRRQRQNLFHQLILEQEQNVLVETLRERAKERLRAEFEGKIRDDRWEECFDVAEQLIKMSARPMDSHEEPGPSEPGSDE